MPEQARFWKTLVVASLVALAVVVLGGCGPAEEAGPAPQGVAVVLACGTEVACDFRFAGLDDAGRPRWELSCTDPGACR